MMGLEQPDETSTAKKNKKNSHPWSHFLYFFFLFKEAEGKQKRQCRLHSYSHVLSQKVGSRSFSGTTATSRKAGEGWGLSPWKHPPWTITSRVGASTRKKKINGRVQSLTLSIFFILFKIFFLNAVFESFVVFFSVSKLEVQSHRKKCLCLIYQDATKDPEKKKGIAYLHQEVWGDSTFFWQSSQSSYMSVSRLSFLVICDMISDLLIPSVQV